MAEAETNLAINVLPGLSESYEVQGRGELQLGALFWNPPVNEIPKAWLKQDDTTFILIMVIDESSV